MQRKFLLGVFDDEHEMIHAAKELKESRIRIHDIFTPFPVHGLDELLEIKRTRLPIVTLIAGATGCALALLFQYWTSVVDWPLNVGGKAFNSFAAFVPIGFEITILFGAFLTVFAFLGRSKLVPLLATPGYHSGASQDKFVIAVELNDASIDVNKLKRDLSTYGAAEVEIKEV